MHDDVIASNNGDNATDTVCDVKPEDLQPVNRQPVPNLVSKNSQLNDGEIC